MVALNRAEDVPFDDQLLGWGRRVLLLTPVWWAMGLHVGIYQALGFCGILLLLINRGVRNRVVHSPPEGWACISLATVYFFSIFVNRSGYGFDRIIGAFNNLSYWAMGMFVIILLSNTFRERHLKQFLRIFPWLAGSSGVVLMLILPFALKGELELIIDTPLARLLGSFADSALLEFSVRMRLITADYVLGQDVPRMMIFSPYPTASGCFFMLTTPMLVAWGVALRKVGKPLFWLLLSVQILGLFASFARTAIVGLVVSVVIVFILERRHAISLGVLTGVLALIASPVAIEFAAEVIAMREGSSLSRFSLYRESLGMMQDYEWIIGRGIRVPSVTQGMPLGSHSTIVSLLYRTGVFGFCCFIVFQATLLFRWFKNRPSESDTLVYQSYWRASGVIFFSMGMWCITEDLDAPQLIAFLYFASIGLFECVLFGRCEASWNTRKISQHSEKQLQRLQEVWS